jgi:hypothetical protein
MKSVRRALFGLAMPAWFLTATACPLQDSQKRTGVRPARARFCIRSPVAEPKREPSSETLGGVALLGTRLPGVYSIMHQCLTLGRDRNGPGCQTT